MGIRHAVIMALHRIREDFVKKQCLGWKFGMDGWMDGWMDGPGGVVG